MTRDKAFGRGDVGRICAVVATWELSSNKLFGSCTKSSKSVHSSSLEMSDYLPICFYGW